MKILASRLYAAESARQNAARSAERRSQVGTGMRNERIRTYNFPQGRVTDHRIGLTYKLDQVLDGDLDEIIDALTGRSGREAARIRGGNMNTKRITTEIAQAADAIRAGQARRRPDGDGLCIRRQRAGPCCRRADL